MFTGITEELGRVKLIQPDKLIISATNVLEGTELGSSIAVNGVCLTVTGFDSQSFSVDVMPETLRRSNLGLLKIGDEVNLERPMLMGGRLGGHLVQGHIDDTGRVTNIKQEKDAILMRFETPRRIMRYIVEKGFIAIDGISLTVVERERDFFSISLIKSTQRYTTMGKRKVGDMVNLEVDIIAKYVESFTNPESSKITVDFLQEHGFVTNR